VQEIISTAKKWLKAGPRRFLFFDPHEVKPLIIVCDDIVPGINVIIREITMALSYGYRCKSVYGSRFGFEGLLKG